MVKGDWSGAESTLQATEAMSHPRRGSDPHRVRRGIPAEGQIRWTQVQSLLEKVSGLAPSCIPHQRILNPDVPRFAGCSKPPDAAFCQPLRS